MYARTKFILALQILASCATVPSLPPSNETYVIDGDSLKLRGENTRIVGLNAPETVQAQCAAERKLAETAKLFLASLIANSENLQIIFERKRNGELRRNKYGRLLARVFVNGKDIADLMINAGYAEPFDGTGQRCNWCEI